MPTSFTDVTPSPLDGTPDWIALVREKVESLRYGVVQLVAHDGRVTQSNGPKRRGLPPAAPHAIASNDFLPTGRTGGIHQLTHLCTRA